MTVFSWCTSPLISLAVVFEGKGHFALSFHGLLSMNLAASTRHVSHS